MKRTQTLAATTALALCLGVATASAAPEQPKPKQIASALCVAQKQADKAAFEAAYGKNAMRDCKRANSQEAGEVSANAAQACKAEQAADPEAFAATYGTNPNGRNAFGKCVSAQVQDETEVEEEQFENAAQQCRAERRADPVAFTETYGTNANGRNAFGKCVSSKSEDEVETEEPVEETV